MRLRVESGKLCWFKPQITKLKLANSQSKKKDPLVSQEGLCQLPLFNQSRIDLI